MIDFRAPPVVLPSMRWVPPYGAYDACVLAEDATDRDVLSGNEAADRDHREKMARQRARKAPCPPPAEPYWTAIFAGETQDPTWGGPFS